MSETVSQADRMEEALEHLRTLQRDAIDQKDPNRVITLTRVILQQETAISKQRVHEGKTLDQKTIGSRRDELARAVITIAKKHLPDKEAYNSFIDDVLEELGALWLETPPIA